MPIITDGEYEEFDSLRRHYRQDIIRQSAVALTLEQDIDAPIKKCVMAMALLGCEPMWSCCGFDYAGQPIHKAHQDNRAGIVMRDNARSRWVADMVQQADLGLKYYNNLWKPEFWKHCGDEKISLSVDVKYLNTWPSPDCIHFSEPAAISIQLLENFLLSLSGEFADTATLADTNMEFQRRFTWWQYPIKAPWVIYKADLKG